MGIGQLLAFVKKTSFCKFATKIVGRTQKYVSDILVFFPLWASIKQKNIKIIKQISNKKYLQTTTDSDDPFG